MNKTNKRNDKDFDKDSFPIFVVDFLVNKFGKKNIIDQVSNKINDYTYIIVSQHSLDILFSTEHYKKENKDIEIFAKFLNEEYESEDLIFYLFVRASIEKELKILLIEKSRDDIKIQYNVEKEELDLDLYLNIKNCMRSKLF